MGHWLRSVFFSLESYWIWLEKRLKKFNVNQRIQNRIWNQRRIYGHHQRGGHRTRVEGPQRHILSTSQMGVCPPAQQGASDGCWSNGEWYQRLGGKIEPEVEWHPIVSAESWLCWKVTLLIIQMELAPFVANLTLLTQVNEQLTVKLNQ